VAGNRKAASMIPLITHIEAQIIFIALNMLILFRKSNNVFGFGISNFKIEFL
jgi:hypothetical protein